MSISNNAIVATPAAIQHLKKHLSKHGGEAVRLNIVKSGCSGYRYEVTFVNDEHPSTEQDKVFLLDEHLSLYVSRKVYPMVMGTKIDYIKKGLGEGELAYNNPQQTGECGCGESFTMNEKGK
jgi:iron-sulfur cluster assembly accessory protein